MAERRIVAPEGVDWEAPGRRDYFVRFEHTTLWAQHLVPVTVLVGPRARPGRGLVATGSTHGDEYEGPVALKKLLGEIRVEEVAGRIVLIPVLNVMAFQAGRRESPDDGANLNRVFPGSATGTITSRIADFLTRFVFPQVHLVMDIHAGGEVARFALHSSFLGETAPDHRKDVEAIARGFGSRFVRIWRAGPGVLHGTARSLGKLVIGGEYGWGRAVGAEGVAIVRRGILGAAIREGQLEGRAPDVPIPRERQILVDTSDPASSVLAPLDGLFEPLVALEDRVSRGQPVGNLHDFNRLDDPPLELPAPHDGYVICQAWGARVIQGQVLTQVGRTVPWTESEM